MTASLTTTSKLLLGSALACALLAGCNKREDTVATPPATTVTPAVPETPATPPADTAPAPVTPAPDATRSEERRVGKECPV